MKVLKETYERDTLHEQWESTYRNNPIQHKLNDNLMNRIMGHLNPSPNALFLDAGCGTGDHAIRIAKRGYRCVGVDISEKILMKAGKKISANGMESSVTLQCESLEKLSFSDETFDFVHCRGVLMHIPDWEGALYNLCRVLKPGGRMVIMESNHKSLETLIVLLARRIMKRRSKMIKNQDGIEFWSSQDGSPFVVRIADLDHLIQRLTSFNVETIHRFASEFLDINRVPSGIMRDMIIRFNFLWFSLRLPAFISSGNCLIGEKRLT